MGDSGGQRRPPRRRGVRSSARTRGHTDLERLARGQVGAQFWSVYVPGEYRDSGYARIQLEQIDIARQVIARYPERLALALTAADIEREFRRGRIASLLGAEGGHVLENSLGALRTYYDLGVRYSPSSTTPSSTARAGGCSWERDTASNRESRRAEEQKSRWTAPWERAHLLFCSSALLLPSLPKEDSPQTPPRLPRTRTTGSRRACGALRRAAAAGGDAGNVGSAASGDCRSTTSSTG